MEKRLVERVENLEEQVALLGKLLLEIEKEKVEKVEVKRGRPKKDGG
jgi:hypothetical protein